MTENSKLRQSMAERLVNEIDNLIEFVKEQTYIEAPDGDDPGRFYRLPLNQEEKDRLIEIDGLIGGLASELGIPLPEPPDSSEPNRVRFAGTTGIRLMSSIVLSRCEIEASENWRMQMKSLQGAAQALIPSPNLVASTDGDQHTNTVREHETLDAPKALESDKRFLDIQVKPENRAATRGGDPCKFGKKDRAWQLFLSLWNAGEEGIDKSELREMVWRDKVIGDNSLDQQKKIANDLLIDIEIEIVANNRGVWRLASLNPCRKL